LPVGIVFVIIHVFFYCVIVNSFVCYATQSYGTSQARRLMSVVPIYVFCDCWWRCSSKLRTYHSAHKSAATCTQIHDLRASVNQTSYTYISVVIYKMENCEEKKNDTCFEFQPS